MGDFVRARTARALVSALALVLVLTSACGEPKAMGPAPPPAADTGPTTAQLVALRSVPASAPITGPRVPEIFSLTDAENITGEKDIKITAQA